MKILKCVFLLIVLATTSCIQEKKLKQETKSSIYNSKDLIAVLDTIWRDEQEPERLIEELIEKFGAESNEVIEQHVIYRRNHAINERKIRAILDTQGWPKKEIIGEQGNRTISNVIQHSANEIRIKYLPMMKKAVKEKQLSPTFLVRAEDRIATETGNLQIYGGQFKYYPETKTFNVWPVYDPVNIDKRRAKIGLGPIAEYLKSRFNFEWNLDEQIKRTADYEKERNTKVK